MQCETISSNTETMQRKKYWKKPCQNTNSRLWWWESKCFLLLFFFPVLHSGVETTKVCFKHMLDYGSFSQLSLTLGSFQQHTLLCLIIYWRGNRDQHHGQLLGLYQRGFSMGLEWDSLTAAPSHGPMAIPQVRRHSFSLRRLCDSMSSASKTHTSVPASLSGLL